MSDIVNPRIESYYLHPKKFAWRSDREFVADQSAIPSESITSVIAERFKMVISSTHQSGDLHPPPKQQLSQEAPLDFSVKPTFHSPDIDQTELVSARDERGMQKELERHQVGGSNRQHPDSFGRNSLPSPVPVVGGSNKQHPDSFGKNSLPSPVPVVCGSNKQHPDSFGKNSLPSPVPIHNGSPLGQSRGNFNHSPNSRLCSGNGLTDQSRGCEPMRTSELGHLQSSNHHGGAPSPVNKTREEVRSPPGSSRETSPDHDRYKGSILHEVLARNDWPQESSQNANPSTRSVQRTDTPPCKTAMNSSPDTGAALPPVNTLLPGHNPLIPATFGMFNGLAFPPTAMNPYVNGGMLSPTMDVRTSQSQNSSEKKQGKPVRPFKALTNELLYGIPTMGMTTINPMMPSGGYFRDYVQVVSKATGDLHKSPLCGVQTPTPQKDLADTPSGLTSAITDFSPAGGQDHKLDVPGSGDSNCSFQDGAESSSASHRKRGRMLPEDLKDEAYWERRRKNNQAAKRSRDARRQKEDMVAQQAWLFREQNIQLRFQMSALEEQHQRLQVQFRAVSEQCRNLELQLRMVSEKAARARCGKCGSRTGLVEAGEKD